MPDLKATGSFSALGGSPVRWRSHNKQISRGERRVAGILSLLKNLIDEHAQILTRTDAIDREAENFGVLFSGQIVPKPSLLTP